jgi:methylenetetrahydrofolate--tRNA-(uracil-5-)-methyltransferase
MVMTQEFHVVGGGLAGVEVAYQLLRAGQQVTLHEMRPKKMTPAHQTGSLAELVCSNSLKSKDPMSATGELKREMAILGSLVLASAHRHAVPAGQALAVERIGFATAVTDGLLAFPKFTLAAEEITILPSAEAMKQAKQVWILATGPLSSAALMAHMQEVTGHQDRLFFYDAIAPVVDIDSLDETQGYWTDRWSDEESGTGDYFNIPLNREQYDHLVTEILAADKMPLHEFEKTKYFESCLPIEVMAERGPETLRFGPMRPVGLRHPVTKEKPWAVIQLRRENHPCTMMSMVGFQTKMKWPEQKRVFQQLPCLRDAEFLRFGSVHRNTFFNSPTVLGGDLSFRANPNLFLAGQLTGVEGYTESAAVGLVLGYQLARRALGQAYEPLPKASVLGALVDYVTKGGQGDFQPMNAHQGMLPFVERQRGVSKQARKVLRCQLAASAFDAWFASQGEPADVDIMKAARS